MSGCLRVLTGTNRLWAHVLAPLPSKPSGQVTQLILSDLPAFKFYSNHFLRTTYFKVTAVAIGVSPLINAIV